MKKHAAITGARVPTDTHLIFPHTPSSRLGNQAATTHDAWREFTSNIFRTDVNCRSKH
jgi:hypothetical protein